MKARRTAAVLTLLLSATPTVRLSAQRDVDRLAIRFASMTAVTGLEQAMVDSLRALFPGSTRDQVGNVTLTLGQGAPKRLCTCPRVSCCGGAGGGVGGGEGEAARGRRCSISSSRVTV